MAKMYFYYGAMGSSKTADAIMTAYNYKERGQNPLLVKADKDTRDGERIIKSRIGLSAQCMLLSEVLSLTEKEICSYDVVIVDEVQFATAKQIDFLSDIVDDYNIPVLCYGLRTDFQLNFFEGSERLMAIADEFHELKTMCWCGRKASCNARYDSNGIVKSGKQVVLGSNDKYIPLCRKHYKLGMLDNWRGDGEPDIPDGFYVIQEKDEDEGKKNKDEGKRDEFELLVSDHPYMKYWHVMEEIDTHERNFYGFSPWEANKHDFFGKFNEMYEWKRNVPYEEWTVDEIAEVMDRILTDLGTPVTCGQVDDIPFYILSGDKMEKVLVLFQKKKGEELDSTKALEIAKLAGLGEEETKRFLFASIYVILKDE